MKRKCSSFILVMLMLVTVLAGCTQNSNQDSGQNATTPVSDNKKKVVVGQEDMLLTFCVMSDVHIGDNNTEKSFTRAMSYMSSVNVAPEAYLFAGDLTDTTGNTLAYTQVELFKSIYERYASPSQMMYCLGPTHDVPHSGSGDSARILFKYGLGRGYREGNLEPKEIGEQGIRWMQVNGFDFFGIDWEGSSGSGAPVETALSWLEEQLTAATEADPDKPIFVIIHVPNLNSVVSILRQFPQVVCFTGHLHNSVAREDSISQDEKFTSIHCGGQNYYRVTGYERFNENPYLNLGNIYEFGQALYVQVDQHNNVIVTRVDTYNMKVLENKWVVGPDRRDVYTKDRIHSVEKCLFQKDDVLSIQEAEENQLMVSFDACKTGGAGPALYYQIQLLALDTSGAYQVVDHKELSSQQVFYPNDEGIPSLHYSYTFSGVDCLDNYAVVVTAKDCWNISGNALVYTNGTYVSDIPIGGTVKFGN